MAFHHLFPAVAMSRPQDLMGLTRRFLDEPIRPEARVELIRASTWLFVTLEIIGAKAPALDVLARMRAAMADIDEDEVNAWAYFRGAEANHHDVGEEAPWSCFRANSDSVRGFEQTDDWQRRCLLESYRGKALMSLGDATAAEAVLRANLAVAERRGAAMSLVYARFYLARMLAALGPADTLDEAVHLAEEVLRGHNATLLGPAHGVLARVALRRDDLAAAESESRVACELTRPFPAYSWDIVALRIHVLMTLHRTEEALALAEETFTHLQNIGLAGYGEIDLRLALAEARAAAGRPEAARDMLRETLGRLRVRLLDIPEGEARTRYLEKVETNARLCAMAREHLGEEALRDLER